MNTIDLIDQLDQLGWLTQPITVARPSNKFYAHIDTQQISICAISPTESNDRHIKNVEIDSETAIKFLSGEEALSGWEVLIAGDEYKISKNVKTGRAVYNRVEIQPITEVTWLEVSKKKLTTEDILISISHKNKTASIHYDGSKISTWDRPAKLYFTGEGDPSYLKYAFTLDINIINDIMMANKLSRWPNPIILPLSDTTDLSVYTVRSNLIINLNHI
jgi:hypothetical protein